MLLLLLPPPRPQRRPPVAVAAAAPPTILSKRQQYRCPVHAAVRAEEDAVLWLGASALDGRVVRVVVVVGDGDEVREVVLVVLVLVALVLALEGSRFAFLGVERGVPRVLGPTQLVLGLGRTRRGRGLLSRMAEARMARLVLRVAGPRPRLRLRRRMRRLWVVGNRSGLFRARCM
jgi:hypothetical protein